MKALKGKYLFGGVHPRDMKYIAKAAPIEVMPPPAVAGISTAQSLGKPAVPTVEVGQSVKEGELIARADGIISSDVFSSVAGKVIEIKNLRGAGGTDENYIMIERGESLEKSWLAPLSNPPRAKINR